MLPPISDAIVLVVVAGASVAAALIDLRTGRIPNPLTAAVAAAGLGLTALGLTSQSIGGALGGAAIGFTLLLPGYIFGGTGAGDVKLLAALGIWLGPAGALMAFFYSAIAGGVLAVAHAAKRRRLAATLGRTARLVASPASTKQEIDETSAASRFCYGPALAIGAIAAVLF